MSTSVAGSCCRGEHAIVRVAGMSREKTQGATPKRAGRRKLREGRSVSARVARCRELREKKARSAYFYVERDIQAPPSIGKRKEDYPMPGRRVAANRTL
jgi:hypothetical protein